MAHTIRHLGVFHARAAILCVEIPSQLLLSLSGQSGHQLAIFSDQKLSQVAPASESGQREPRPPATVQE